jgi:hypothetical protein
VCGQMSRGAGRRAGTDCVRTGTAVRSYEKCRRAGAASAGAGRRCRCPSTPIGSRRLWDRMGAWRLSRSRSCTSISRISAARAAVSYSIRRRVFSRSGSRGVTAAAGPRSSARPWSRRSFLAAFAVGGDRGAGRCFLAWYQVSQGRKTARTGRRVRGVRHPHAYGQPGRDEPTVPGGVSRAPIRQRRAVTGRRRAALPQGRQRPGRTVLGAGHRACSAVSRHPPQGSR